MCLFFIYFCLFILLWRPNFKRNTWTAWLVISLAKIAIGYKLDTNQHCCAMVVKLLLFWVVLTKYEAKEIRIDTSSNLCQTFTLKNYLVLLMNIYYASSIYPRLCAGHRWHNGGKFYPLLPALKCQLPLHYCTDPVLTNTFLRISQVPIPLSQEMPSKPAGAEAQVPQGVLKLGPLQTSWASDLAPTSGVAGGEAWQANPFCWPVWYFFPGSLELPEWFWLIVYISRNHWELPGALPTFKVKLG